MYLPWEREREYRLEGRGSYGAKVVGLVGGMLSETSYITLHYHLMTNATGLPYRSDTATGLRTTLVNFLKHL